MELTPSRLLKMLKDGGLTSLLLLVGKEVTPEIEESCSNYKVYWVNR